MTAALLGSYFWVFGGQSVSTNSMSQHWGSSWQANTRVDHAELIGVRCMPEEVSVPAATLVVDLSAIFKSGAVADVTIECRDGILRAHKAILGLRCQYFLDVIVELMSTGTGLVSAASSSAAMLHIGALFDLFLYFPHSACHRFVFWLFPVSVQRNPAYPSRV